MKLRWSQLGGQAGVGLIVLGCILLFLGWNGAASYDRVPSQFPYLISGGLAGLSAIVVGAAVLVVQNQRQEQRQLIDAVAELREAVERMSLGAGAAQVNGGAAGQRIRNEAEEAGLLVAGASSFHRPQCRLLDGRSQLRVVSLEDAEVAGLSPCRACDPQMPEPEPDRPATARRGRASGRRAQ